MPRSTEEKRWEIVKDFLTRLTEDTSPAMPIDVVIAAGIALQEIEELEELEGTPSAA